MHIFIRNQLQSTFRDINLVFTSVTLSGVPSSVTNWKIAEQIKNIIFFVGSKVGWAEFPIYHHSQYKVRLSI